MRAAVARMAGTSRAAVAAILREARRGSLAGLLRRSVPPTLRREVRGVCARLLGRGPRVGFYGGMANNTYLMALRMADLGMDVIYIRDRLDNYAMSQACWEDLPLTLPYDALAETSSWTPERWDALAEERGWQRPRWFRDPVDEIWSAEPVLSGLDLSEDLQAFLSNLSPADHSGKIIALMQTCDLLFVCSVHALILALVSGRPFIICPAGGEFMMASGQIVGEGYAGRVYDCQRRLLLLAFRRALAVATHTPFHLHAPLVGGHQRLIEDYSDVRFVSVSLPYQAEAGGDAVSKRAIFDAVMTRLGAAPIATRYAVFVPSRIDYRWKGQDRLLDAIDRMAQPDDYTFVMAGWGADYHDFKRRTAGRSNIVVLDAAVAKPLLYDMYRGADLVVDQFTLGQYGTSTREALSKGAPVMTWVDYDSQKDGTWVHAPVLNARTADEIASWFDRISRGEVDLARVGGDSAAWVATYSSPEVVRDVLLDVYRNRGKPREAGSARGAGP